MPGRRRLGERDEKKRSQSQRARDAHGLKRATARVRAVPKIVQYIHRAANHVKK